MGIQELKENFKEYARDIKLNLPTVLTTEGAPGLSLKQIWEVALACAYTTGSQPLVSALENDASPVLDEAAIQATKGASAIMAMNNIYYRFTHLIEDKEYSKMPAKLRMNVIGKPGVDKIDFEIMCLAVSAINGCAACMNSHAHEMKKAGYPNEAVQSAVRIASVVNAAAQALKIG